MIDLKEVVERVARAWAGQDGKSDLFDKCKTDPELENEMGHYGGYTAEAYDLLKTAGVLEFFESLNDPVMVHCHMATGNIAKPSFENVKNLYADDFEKYDDFMDEVANSVARF